MGFIWTDLFFFYFSCFSHILSDLLQVLVVCWNVIKSSSGGASVNFFFFLHICIFVTVCSQLLHWPHDLAHLLEISPVELTRS